MSLALQVASFLTAISEDFTPPLASTICISDYSRKIVENAVLFSVIEKGQIVALAATYCNDPKGEAAFCTMLGVAKDQRRYGLGASLITSTLSYLDKHGYRKLGLEIYRTNLTALEFYKKMGFRIARETDASVFAEFLIAGRN